MDALKIQSDYDKKQTLVFRELKTDNKSTDCVTKVPINFRFVDM